MVYSLQQSTHDASQSAFVEVPALVIDGTQEELQWHVASPGIDEIRRCELDAFDPIPADFLEQRQTGGPVVADFRAIGWAGWPAVPKQEWEISAGRVGRSPESPNQAAIEQGTNTATTSAGINGDVRQ